MDTLNNYFLIYNCICTFLYLIFITRRLINGTYKDKESIDVFLNYTGGVIGVFMFGGTLLIIGLMFIIPVGLIDLARGRKFLQDF